MSDAALKFLLETVKDVLIDYKNLKKTARKEFEQLQNELGRLEAQLKDAAEMPKKSFTFKENERLVRELVYKVEDTIEIYMTKKAAAKTKNLLARVRAGMSTNLEQVVKDLRQYTVAPALNLLKPPESGNAETAEGSTRTLEQPPTQLKKDKSIANAASENPALKSISHDVESAYKELSYNQKVCFLYTGLFPRDDEITASTLTQLWIAERFIRQETGKTLEKTAEELLDLLISKKLLIPAKRRLDRVKTCRVDDQIREFCQKKAEEENLFTVIEPQVNLDRKLYRLCFHSDPSNFLSKGGKNTWPHVRSFLCLLKEPNFYLQQNATSTIPIAFKPLRILNCESTKFDELPKITSLILLKHITLSIDKLDSLPEYISQLINLQTLIVKTQSHSIEVKANIWKMMQLRHLKTKVTFILDKKWEGKKGAAENLQTISRLSPEYCSKALSQKAPYLKTLGIRGNLEGGLDKSTLVNFGHLENLKLVNHRRYGSTSENPVRTLPRDGFPPILKRLTLSWTYLFWNNHMPVLAGIPNLEVLKVKDNAFKGASWCVADYSFQKLRFLLIENTDLVTWEASTAQFPQLKWLVIKSCEKRPKVPPSLSEHVEKLDIDEASKNPQPK